MTFTSAMDRLDGLNPWIHLIMEVADKVPTEISAIIKEDIQQYWSEISLDYVRLNDDRDAGTFWAIYNWPSAIRLVEQTEEFLRLYGFLLQYRPANQPA